MTRIYKIWIGPNPLPDHFKQYTDTWSRISGAEIIDIGNECLYEIRHSAAVQWAQKHNNWAVLNHYLRYWLLYDRGGIYLDLDVEVIRDSMVWKSPYIELGMELPNWINNHVMIANESNSQFFWDCMLAMDTMPYDQMQEVELNTGPRLVTRILQYYGFTPMVLDKPRYHSVQDKFLIHPERVFSPHRWNQTYHPDEIKEDTLAVHHFAHSWKP